MNKSINRFTNISITIKFVLKFISLYINRNKLELKKFYIICIYLYIFMNVLNLINEIKERNENKNEFAYQVPISEFTDRFPN